MKTANIDISTINMYNITSTIVWMVLPKRAITARQTYTIDQKFPGGRYESRSVSTAT